MYFFPTPHPLLDQRVSIATTVMLRDSGEIYLKTHHKQQTNTEEVDSEREILMT